MEFWAFVILLFVAGVNETSVLIPMGNGRRFLAAVAVLGIVIWALYAFGILPNHRF